MNYDKHNKVDACESTRQQRQQQQPRSLARSYRKEV